MKKPEAPQPGSIVTVVGVAWYRAADWPRVKALFADADNLDDTHAEWLKGTERAVKELRRQGLVVEPVVLDIDRFLLWCTTHGRNPDAAGRVDYTIEMVQAKSRRPESEGMPSPDGR